MSQYRTDSDIPKGHHWKDYYTKFCRAKSEDTLDLMNERASGQVSNLPYSEEVKNWISTDIYFAYSKRQEELDGSVRKRVIRNKSEKESSSSQASTSSSEFNVSFKRHEQEIGNMPPEKQMAYLLNRL